MSTYRLLYYVSSGLLSLMMLYSAIGLYLFNTSEVQATFQMLGFPAYLVVPLAIMKILGVAALLTQLNKTLMEWAFAGFFFNFILAASAHLNQGDGEAGGAFIALLLLGLAYFAFKNDIKKNTHS